MQYAGGESGLVSHPIYQETPVKHALAAALCNKSVHATVLWYGQTVNDPEQRQLSGPALLVVGSHGI
jgi:hypothetical protein